HTPTFITPAMVSLGGITEPAAACPRVYSCFREINEQATVHLWGWSGESVSDDGGWQSPDLVVWWVFALICARIRVILVLGFIACAVQD
ncbi:MAG: hypothetical protein ACF8LL_03385, partial [Phycisphaerales bacterium]